MTFAFSFFLRCGNVKNNDKSKSRVKNPNLQSSIMQKPAVDKVLYIKLHKKSSVMTISATARAKAKFVYVKNRVFVVSNLRLFQKSKKLINPVQGSLHFFSGGLQRQAGTTSQVVSRWFSFWFILPCFLVLLCVLVDLEKSR